MVSMVIVGTGWWGMELGKAAHAIPDAAMIAGCFSLSAEECARFKAAYGGEVYASFDAVLADPAVDAVFLATPHSLHAGQIVAAAGAGKHVFCEKPMTLTVDSAARAIAACSRSDTTGAIRPPRAG